jgi:hypothetical protein
MGRRLTTAAAPVVAPPVVAAAEPGAVTVVAVQVIGDPSKRFNMIVLGDGYTEAVFDCPRFARAVIGL